MDPTRSILYQDSRYIPLKVGKLKNKAAYIRTLILPRDSGRKMKKRISFPDLQIDIYVAYTNILCL